MGLHDILLTSFWALQQPWYLSSQWTYLYQLKHEQNWGVSRSRASAPTPFYLPLVGKTQALSMGLPMAMGMLHSMPVK